MLGRWRFRARAADRPRYLSLASLRWVLRHRAYTPWYLLRYWRFWRFTVANPHVVTTGFVFLGKNVELFAPAVGNVFANGTQAGSSWNSEDWFRQ